MRGLVAVLFLVVAGCAMPGAERPQAPPDGPLVHVADHGLHSGLIVRIADLPPGALPVLRHFPRAEFLELGWGDREYYRSKDFSLWLAARAALWPTESAVHVVGFSGSIGRQFPAAEIATLRLSRPGFARMLDFIAATFETGADGEGRILGPGQREASLFFASGRRFHLFQNCNTWVAQALREAGVPAPLR